MRFVTYDRGGTRRLGALVLGNVVDLPDAVGHPSFPTTMEALVAFNGGTTLDAAAHALSRPEQIDECVVRNPRLLVPIIPTSLREFTGTPATNGNRRVLGPDEEIAWPTAARYLGCELEVACIVGRHGRKLSRARATSAIFGYTLMGDWSAWEARRKNGERRSRGLASSEFAISLGPCIITADEFDPGGVRLVARIDDEVWSEGALDVSGPSFPEIIAEVSRTEEITPGEVYGSAAFGYGYRIDPGRSLHRGARVDLVADGIGTLSTRIALRG